MSRGRNEPAGQPGLRNKSGRHREGLWSLGKRKAKVTHLREEGRRAQTWSGKTVCAGSSIPRVFICSPKVGTPGEVPGEDQNGIVISFPGVPFQGHGLYWLVGIGTGVISHHSWSYVSQGITPPGPDPFLGLEVKHNWNVISSSTKTLSLVVNIPEDLLLRLFDPGQNLIVLRS